MRIDRFQALVFSAVVGALFFIAGCGTPIPERDIFTPGKHSSMAEYLSERGLETSHEPVALPSELFKAIPTSQRRDFLKEYFSLFLKKAKSQAFIAAWLKGSFGLTVEEDDELMALSRGEEAALEKLAARVDISSQGKELDTFPTVPLEAVPGIEKSLFDANPEDPKPLPEKSFPGNYPESEWKDVTLRFNSCDPLRPWSETALPEYGLSTYQEPIGLDAYAVPCYRENSELLAKLMNLLAKTNDQEKIEIKLRWQLLRKLGDKDLVRTIDSYQSLIEELGRYYFNFEIMQTRSWLTPFFLSWQDGDERKSLRTAMWIEIPMENGKRIRVPAEKSEIQLILRWGNQRLAGVVWSFDPSSAANLSEAVLWRPQIFLRPSWGPGFHEGVNSYAPKESKALTNYFLSIAQIMKAFHAVENHFHPDVSPYGLFPFGDAVAWALAKNVDLAKRAEPANRITQAFPSLWTAGPVMDLFFKVSDLSPERWAKHVTPDAELSQDPLALKERLSLSFKPDADRRFEAFADFKENDLSVIRKWVPATRVVAKERSD